MMKRSEIFFSTLLVPVDFFALLAGFVVAYYVRDSLTGLSGTVSAISSEVVTSTGGLQPLTHYLHYIWYIIPAMLVIFAFVGLYTMRSATSWPRRFFQILLGVTGGEFFILLLFLLKKDFFLPRSTVLYSWILCTIFVTIARYGVRLLQKFLYRYDIGSIRVAIIGRSEAARQIMKNLGSRLHSTYQLEERFEGVGVSEVIPLISRDKFDELIVVNTQYSVEDLISLRNHCLEQHVGFSFVPSLFSSLRSSFEIRSEVGLPMIEVLPTPLEGWGRVVKRLFDIIASIILLILFSPVYLLIAIILKTTDPGPLFIRHTRIGLRRTPICITKFRSMRMGWTDENGKLSKHFQKYLDTHPEAAKEWQETVKLKDDPRISKMGRILRKTRLDELPQFFDVLVGALSLVGPRPIVDWEVEKFGEKARILFTVRPGVTGPWQVEGGNDLSYEKRVELNAIYIEHWSIWRDLSILLKTAWLLLSDLVGKLFGKDGDNGAY